MPGRGVCLEGGSDLEVELYHGWKGKGVGLEVGECLEGEHYGKADPTRRQTTPPCQLTNTRENISSPILRIRVETWINGHTKRTYFLQNKFKKKQQQLVAAQETLYCIFLLRLTFYRKTPCVTCDFREDRVRIYVNNQNKVVRAPKCG